MTHLRLLADNKKIEVDCMFLSRIETVIHPVDIPVVPEDVLHLHPEESGPFWQRTQDSMATMVKTVVAVYSALMDIETHLFRRRSLDVLHGLPTAPVLDQLPVHAVR